MSRSTTRSSGASSPTDLELDLADGRGDDRAEVRHARRPDRLAEPHGTLQGGRLEHLHVRDRHADRHARPLADLRGATREMGDLGDDLLHERRHDDGRGTVRVGVPATSANRCFSCATIDSSSSSERG